jgi:hypothetical protein
MVKIMKRVLLVIALLSFSKVFGMEALQVGLVERKEREGSFLNGPTTKAIKTKKCTSLHHRQVESSDEEELEDDVFLPLSKVPALLRLKLGLTEEEFLAQMARAKIAIEKQIAVERKVKECTAVLMRAKGRKYMVPRYPSERIVTERMRELLWRENERKLFDLEEQKFLAGGDCSLSNNDSGDSFLSSGMSGWQLNVAFAKMRTDEKL